MGEGTDGTRGADVEGPGEGGIFNEGGWTWAIDRERNRRLSVQRGGVTTGQTYGGDKLSGVQLR